MAGLRDLFKVGERQRLPAFTEEEAELLDRLGLTVETASKFLQGQVSGEQARTFFRYALGRVAVKRLRAELQGVPQAQVEAAAQAVCDDLMKVFLKAEMREAETPVKKLEDKCKS